MARVWQATDAQVYREVALKILPDYRLLRTR